MAELSMAASEPHPHEYEFVIEPNRSWLAIPWRALWDYRDLLVLLVRREFVSKYKQTILGPIWFVLQPLFTTVVFTVIFGNVAHIPTDGLPRVLFYLSGLVAWNYFAQNLAVASATFTANAYIFGKVYFPRLIVPLSVVVSNVFTLAIQLATFLAFFAYFKFFTSSGHLLSMHWSIVFLPLLVGYTAAISLGFSLVLASMTAKYRDLTHMLQLLIQLWMFATPVIYPLSEVSEKWRWIATLNPMTSVVECYRLMLMSTASLSWEGVFISLGVSAVALIAGVFLFQKTERTFIDTV